MFKRPKIQVTCYKCQATITGRTHNYSETNPPVCFSCKTELRRDAAIRHKYEQKYGKQDKQLSPVRNPGFDV